jgi:carbon storage regulator
LTVSAPAIRPPTGGIPVLVLTRKVNQIICVGDDIEIIVLSHNSSGVRLGITAKKDVRIDRKEVRDAADYRRGSPTHGDGIGGAA